MPCNTFPSGQTPAAPPATSTLTHPLPTSCAIRSNTTPRSPIPLHTSCAHQDKHQLLHPTSTLTCSHIMRQSGQAPLHTYPPPSRTMRPSNRLSIHHRRYLRIVLKKPAKIKLIIKSQFKCNPLYRLYRHIQLPLGLRHNPFRNQVT